MQPVFDEMIGHMGRLGTDLMCGLAIGLKWALILAEWLLHCGERLEPEYFDVSYNDWLSSLVFTVPCCSPRRQELWLHIHLDQNLVLTNHNAILQCYRSCYFRFWIMRAIHYPLTDSQVNLLCHFPCVLILPSVSLFEPMLQSPSVMWL